MKAPRRKTRRVALALVALASLGACSNEQSPCSSPSSGTFSVALSYSQTIPVAIYCDATAGDTTPCGSPPHAFDGATWNIAVDGASATVLSNDGGASPWSCEAIPPESSPAEGPDGSTPPGTGCYLLVSCNPESAGDAGPVEVQIQVFASAPDDVIALVHDLSGQCCTDEYTGTWH
jgi:hypothetical protein